MPVSDVWVLTAPPVILLRKIGRLDLLESLAAKAVVPNAVFLEIQAGIGEHQAVRSTADWAAPRRMADLPIPLSIERWDLKPGESQVIAHWCLLSQQPRDNHPAGISRSLERGGAKNHRTFLISAAPARSSQHN